MSKVIINIGFGRDKYTDGELVFKAELIIECQTDNIHLVDPVPGPVALQGLLDTFTLGRLNAQVRRIGTVAEKNEDRGLLEDALQANALWVQTACGGSRSIALGSGHDLKQDSHPIGRLPMPEYYHQANTENTGEVAHKTPPILHAEKYLTETTQTPPGSEGCVIKNWFSNTNKQITDGHTVGQPLYSRVTPIGTFKTLSPSIWYKLDLVT